MTISTHVLDISVGRPAAGVAVRLQRQDRLLWTDVSSAVTDQDGRVSALVPPAAAAAIGEYRLSFAVGDYFRARGIESFYSTISIDFLVRDASAPYHVPLLLSPFGYSTYRGS